MVGDGSTGSPLAHILDFDRPPWQVSSNSPGRFAIGGVVV
jgi:hypothetical protein